MEDDVGVVGTVRVLAVDPVPVPSEMHHRGRVARPRIRQPLHHHLLELHGVRSRVQRLLFEAHHLVAELEVLVTVTLHLERLDVDAVQPWQVAAAELDVCRKDVRMAQLKWRRFGCIMVM